MASSGTPSSGRPVPPAPPSGSGGSRGGGSAPPSGGGTAPPAPPAGSGGSGPGASGGGGSSKTPTGVSATRIKTAATSHFIVPPGTRLEHLSGQNWNAWSGIMSALLSFNDVDCILSHDTCPNGVDADDWGLIQKRSMAYLRLYCEADVYSTVESDADFPSFKKKFDHLRDTYGGVGSVALYNLWIELTRAKLDDTSPLAPQLAKLNETRVKLSNARMGVTDVQYSLILLNALPDSYEVVASTILASGPASSLKYSEIVARILNEEGRKSGPSASLNAARTGKNSNITCRYCNKKGHHQRDCRKKKKDDAEKKEEEEENDSTEGSTDSGTDDNDSDSNKEANVHVLL